MVEQKALGIGEILIINGTRCYRMLKIIRSPARVVWNLTCNGIVIKVGEKKELEAIQGAYARKYGLTIA